uniref:Uncharacterized protein n=1 Tax=Arundo donax TaxID=35708 RepID=A0A0A8Y856_ARUDO
MVLGHWIRAAGACRSAWTRRTWCSRPVDLEPRACPRCSIK